MTCDAFVSYTRIKDVMAPSPVSKFVERLENHMRRQTGNVSYSVFQDKTHISPGADWVSRIKSELDSASVLLVLLSPTWIRSDWCKAEYQIFKDSTRASGRKRLVIPLLWDPFPSYQVLSPTPEENQILNELRQIHHADWSKLQFDSWSSARPNRAASALATSIIKQL
jgi:cobaltochelatase CobT